MTFYLVWKSNSSRTMLSLQSTNRRRIKNKGRQCKRYRVMNIFDNWRSFCFNPCKNIIITIVFALEVILILKKLKIKYLTSLIWIQKSKRFFENLKLFTVFITCKELYQKFVNVWNIFLKISNNHNLKNHLRISYAFSEKNIRKKAVYFCVGKRRYSFVC